MTGDGNTDGTESSGKATASAYEPLFGAPATTKVTPGSLTGLWAGTMSSSNDDFRLKLSSSSIIIAVKCNSGYGRGTQTVIGLEVSAEVTSTSIRIVESKSVGSDTCMIVVRPQTLAACELYAASSSCFSVKDTTLSLAYSPLFTDGTGSSQGPNRSLIKLSD